MISELRYGRFVMNIIGLFSPILLVTLGVLICLSVAFYFYADSVDKKRQVEAKSIKKQVSNVIANNE
jgi:hypothetical protein